MPDSPKKPRFQWFSKLKSRLGFGDEYLDEIDQADSWFGTQALNGGYGATALQGQGDSRNRLMIYQKWQSMISDPIVSSAIRQHCTAALGGHATSGQVVFIERTAAAEKDDSLALLVSQIGEELAPLMNKIAYTVTFNAATFGDGFARIYAKQGVGVIDAYVDEMVMPPMVQPYEKGGTTIGFVVYIGRKMRERLSPAQMIRMRMPRTIYVPQPLAMEKSWRMLIAEDDIEKLPVMPATAGGSFLDGAEEAYDRYIGSLLALVGTRFKNSIDARLLKANMADMTKDQQDTFTQSIVNFQNYVKALQRLAIKTKSPILETIIGLLPVANDKQLTTLESDGPGDTSQGVSIEDVMLHAKLLAGSLGSDITLLGMADLMSGGLGDGGFFRTSANAAEKSRMIRVALDEFFNQMVELHLIYSRKMEFDPKDRPWKVNFYGTISALESERKATRESEMTSGSTLVDTLDRLKTLNLPEDGCKFILSKVMGFADDEAQLLAKSLIKAQPATEEV